MYIMDEDRVNYYLKLMQDNDSRTKIVGMQQMLFSIEGGLLLTPYDKLRVVDEIYKIISNHKDDRVRQWGYMIAAFLISRKLAELCSSKLESEPPKNQTWILAVLSNNYTESEFLKIRKKAENYLSEAVITLSTYLFSNYQVDLMNVNTLIQRGDDDLALLWLGWIATFHNQNLRLKKPMVVSEVHMSELSGVQDDNVLKHIMAAFSRRKHFCVDSVQFDIFNYKNMENEHKKWTMAAIFKDHKFIKENKDYILELLSKHHLFHLCDKRVREGLASGLSTYIYDPDFVYSVVDWYSNELEESVKQYLLKYMIKWEDECDDYIEVINSVALRGTDADKLLIASYGKRTVHTKFQKDKSSEILSGSPTIISLIFQIAENGGINNYEEVRVMNETNIAKQVGNQGSHAGEKSTINMFFNEAVDGEQFDFESLLKEIASLKAYYKNEPDSVKNQIIIGKLAEAEVAVESKKKDQVISALKSLGKEVYDIAKKISCSLLAALIKDAII